MTFCIGVAGFFIIDGNLDAATVSYSKQAEKDSGVELKLFFERNSQCSEKMFFASRDIGQCMGACASEQGICIAQCQGNGQCIANCNAAHGRGGSGEHAKAIESYQEALRIDPEDAYAWRGLGIVYANLGQRNKVLEIYQHLKKLDPTMADKFFSNFVMP